MTDSYNADSIEILPGLTAIRKRPGMYVGNTGWRGLNCLIDEVIDNAINEAIGGYVDRIEIPIEADDSVTINNNGRGIPTKIHSKTGKSELEAIFTSLWAGNHHYGRQYYVVGGTHGVGLAVVNALSEWLKVVVYSEGKEYRQEYERGDPTRELQIQEIQGDRRGTHIKSGVHRQERIKLS